MILPDWFDDCFQLQLLCPTDSYLFPEPPLLSAEIADLLSVTSKVFPPVKGLRDRLYSNHSHPEAKPAPIPNLMDGKIFYFDPTIIASSKDVSQKSSASKLVSVVESLGAQVTEIFAEATSVVVETQGPLFELV